MKKRCTNYEVKEAAPGTSDQPVVCTACWRMCVIGYLAVMQTPPHEYITENEFPDCVLEEIAEE